MSENTYVPPYISAGEFVKFIKALPRRKPDPLTIKALQDMGILGSNAYTLKSSLIRMGIYDEEGNLLERDILLGFSLKDENKKRETFKKILERTYQDLIQEIRVEEATVDNVRDYFERKHAAPGPALKGARLFIWLASEAGYKTAEEFTPYNLDQEKSLKQKGVKKKARPDGSTKHSSQQELNSFVSKTPEEEEDRLLDALQEKIRTTQGFPPLELVKAVQELIASKKARSQHTANAPKAPTGNPNSDA